MCEKRERLEESATDDLARVLRWTSAKREIGPVDAYMLRAEVVVEDFVELARHIASCPTCKEKGNE